MAGLLTCPSARLTAATSPSSKSRLFWVDEAPPEPVKLRTVLERFEVGLAEVAEPLGVGLGHLVGEADREA